jgi:nucleotide-binding universal stress UspA family protein
MHRKEGDDMFTRILAATDRVTACDATVAVATRLAREHQAELRILHVAESSAAIDREFIKHYKTGEEMVYNDAYGQAVKEALERSCAEAVGAGITCRIDVMPGFPWMMILKTARKHRSSLIVMGPHAGRAREMGVMRVPGHIGSTVQKVIQRERCPVMLVNMAAGESPLDFKRILLSTDFSKSCECALRFAVDLARKKDAVLSIFHMASGNEEASSAMERFCGGIPAEVAHEDQIGEGPSPSEEILKAADQKGADLIVMGSHTKEKDGRWYIGSAVEGVSLRARCPVCVITDPKVLRPLEID